VVVDIQHDDPRPGDVYCLCSDGLSGMVQDDEILRIVGTAGDVGEACRNLIARANEHGGEDNITAVLIKIEDGQTEELNAVRGRSASPDGPEQLGLSDEPTAPGLAGATSKATS
jgi:protein phosphatase